MNELLNVDHVWKVYQKKGLHLFAEKEPYAVKDVSFKIYQGESFGVIGESGCGKSTIAKMILGLESVSDGEIFFEGENLQELIRKNPMKYSELVQIIFQNVDSSLDPGYKVKKLLEEPFVIHKTDKKEREMRIQELMKRLSVSEEWLERHPAQLSGGQRQRVSLARAIALQPKLLIADEPAASLDVSIQASVLQLLNEMKEENGMSLLYISHNLRIVQHMTDRVAVMYLGEIMEMGKTEDIFRNPIHPYTRILISSMPVLHPRDRHKERQVIRGEISSKAKESQGCVFCGRCPLAETICREQKPQGKENKEGHYVKCHIALHNKEESYAVDQ